MGQLIIKYNQTNRSNKSPKINNREKRNRKLYLQNKGIIWKLLF